MNDICRVQIADKPNIQNIVFVLQSLITQLQKMDKHIPVTGMRLTVTGNVKEIIVRVAQPGDESDSSNQTS